MAAADVVTRRLIAVILGGLGVMVLIDVGVIAGVNPTATFDGFRQVMLIIVGALLIVGGAVSFAWPKRGSVETSENESDKPQST